MFASSTKKLTLTLVASIVLILLLSPVSEANDFHAVRRGHGELKRVIRKRSPQGGGLLGLGEAETETPPVASGSAVPTSSSASSAAVSSLPVPSSSAVSAPVSISSSVPSSSASSSSSVPSASSSAPSSSSSSSSSSSVSSAVTPSTSPSTTAAPATTTNAESAPSQEPDVVVTTINGTVRTKTATAETAAQTEDTSSAPTGATSKTAKTTALTVLIVVASSIGAVVIIWTIFRKWKLARSSKFDQRLQPIDWQPTDREDGIIPAHRRNNSDTSSFHSGHGHGQGGYGATSDHGHGSNNGHGRISPLPDHDFTAGSSNLAPVGGYADLARGPSPSPSMQQLARGPSLTRPTYDTGVPLHHQSPYGARY